MVGVLPLLLAGVLHVSPVPAPSLLELPRPLQRSHDVLKLTTRRYLLPTLEVGAPHAFSFAWAVTFATLNTPVFKDVPMETARRALWEVLYWHPPRYSFWAWNMTHPPIWPDHDGYVVNFVVHPLTGAVIHLLYRNHGVPFWQCILLAFAWSVFWEYVAEGGYERPALNDMVANTAGALAGEAAYRAKVLLKEQLPPGVTRALLLAALDPAGELENLVLDVAEQRLGLGGLVMYLR